MIHNHIAPKLSELDLEIISHVTPGGNWKDVPESVPSQRLKQIRESFAAGKGSRSTYYSRLLMNDPSYTISTYFTRPGNGCNIHYEQDRTLTYREAARLQSFPDSFVFTGSRTAIADQIGNAVPPLLAYQLALALSETPGAFVDLFSGAGGLALGFVWAGWEPIVANDMDSAAMATHRLNFACPAIEGDIIEEAVRAEILEAVREFRQKNPDVPIYVLGGPPCQGFSTANGRRSTSDMRNWLFKEYAGIISDISPDGFVFENVPGILNFEKGKFFEMIKVDLHESVEAIHVEKVNAADFGVPQRRNRVIVVGGTSKRINSFQLKKTSEAPPVVRRELRGKLEYVTGRRAITVGEAISDLPWIHQGEDGTDLSYRNGPESRFQELVRGCINPAEYLDTIR